MTSTTYYNLNIVEGTDIVNPLIIDNPNYEKIDEAMHNNAVAGVTLATEIANATVHAITRENSDCAVIRFIATSQWKAGDTATVDGVPVTALLPSGETLPDGAYVINANVLCILTGTNLTIYAERKKAENANEITFNNTTVGAELVKLDGEIVRLDGEIVRLDEKIDNVKSNLSYNTFDEEELLSITFNNKPLYRKRLYKSNVTLGKGAHIIDGTLIPTYVGTIINLSASANFSSGEKTMLPFVGADSAYTRVIIDSRGLVMHNASTSGNIIEYFVEIVYTKV